MPRKSWWARLPFGVRMVAGTSVLLIAIGGGAAGIAALTQDRAKPRIVTAVGDAAAAGAAPEQPAPPAPRIARGQIGADAARTRTAAEANRTATRNPAQAPAPVGAASSAQAAPRSEASGPAARSPAQPVITTRTEMETREIPYPTRTVRDPSLPRGTRLVQTAGVAGEETLRYLVTLTDGRPTDRRLLDSTVTRPPQQQVVALGDQAGGQHGQGSGRGQNGRGGDHRGHCGATLDFCVPLGRGASCPSDRDQRVEDASAIQLGGEVAVSDTDIGVLSGSGC